MNSKKVKILIVEDEILLSEQMALFLSKNYDITGIAESGEKALSMIEQNQPDLVLMDIELEGKLDGIETAEIIQQKLFIPIIYLTKLYGDKTLNRVKKTMPAAYLSKPFKNHDLKYAIENAIYSRQLHPDKKADKEEPLTVSYHVSVFKNRLFYKKSTGEFYRMFVDDIYYIEFVDRKCNMITKYGTETLNISLKDFFSGIEDSHLLRIHRKYGINITYVNHFTNNLVLLEYPDLSILRSKTEKEFPIGPENKKALMKKLGMLK